MVTDNPKQDAPSSASAINTTTAAASTHQRNTKAKSQHQTTLKSFASNAKSVQLTKSNTVAQPHRRRTAREILNAEKNTESNINAGDHSDNFVALKKATKSHKNITNSSFDHRKINQRNTNKGSISTSDNDKVRAPVTSLSQYESDNYKNAATNTNVSNVPPRSVSPDGLKDATEDDNSRNNKDISNNEQSQSRLVGNIVERQKSIKNAVYSPAYHQAMTIEGHVPKSEVNNRNNNNNNNCYYDKLPTSSTEQIAANDNKPEDISNDNSSSTTSSLDAKSSTATATPGSLSTTPLKRAKPKSKATQTLATTTTVIENNVKSSNKSTKSVSFQLDEPNDAAATLTINSSSSIVSNKGQETKGTTGAIALNKNTKNATKSTIKVSSFVDKTKETEALVLDSLSTLMELAGTLPPIPDSNRPIESGSLVEAKLEFSCMDPAEYAIHQQEQLNEEQQEIIDDEQAFSADIKECVPNGKDDDDDDNSTCVSQTDDNEESDDDLWDLLNSGKVSDDDDADEYNKRNARYKEERAFLKLHSALQQWTTSTTVDYMRGKGRSNVVQPRNDLEASRCAGLQALLRIHVNAALEDLGYGIEYRKKAELSLVPLLYTFDYRYLSPVLDTPLTRALISILLVMVGVTNRKQENDTVVLPPSCQAVGMLPEEYTYLTKSAILAFNSSADLIAGE